MTINKILYVIVGVLIGIIVILLLGQIPEHTIFAAPAKPTESVANADFIAIGSVSKTDNNILWLIDTKGKKLLLYEYFQETAIRLKAVRDIQYDVAIPDEVTMPPRKDDELTPAKIKEIYSEIKKRQEKEKEREKREEKKD